MRELEDMNTFETPASGAEPREHNNEAVLADINEGITNVRRLAYLRVGGANVGAEIELAKEALFQRLAKELADLEQSVLQDDRENSNFGRFDQNPWDKLTK